MGLSAAASRQLPFDGWRRGRNSMRPGIALPGSRAASTSAVNWGRTTIPLSEPLTLQLQALLASARSRLDGPTQAATPAVALDEQGQEPRAVSVEPLEGPPPVRMEVDVPTQPMRAQEVAGDPQCAPGGAPPPETPDAGGPEVRAGAPEPPDAG
eukprot:8769004-Alexandrium_andersonii.AAC.1